MLRSFSNKAIATKARAMYGARVTQADYEELMKKRTVGDAAAYLRDNTHYREVMGIWARSTPPPSTGASWRICCAACGMSSTSG